MITVSEDREIDYELTARLATEAFSSPDVAFSATRLRWFYERSFARGTIVLAVHDDGVKVGHAALVRQLLVIDGTEQSAAQFVDLFLLKKYRSRGSLRKIYQAIEDQCRTQHIRVLLAMPNDKARPVNAFFLKLEPYLTLPIRAGFSLLPPFSSRITFSGRLDSLSEVEAIALFSAFDTPLSENGLSWDGEHLYHRLGGPSSEFGIHATRDLLLISSPRMRRSVPYTLICGVFARSHAIVASGDVRNLVRAACRLWRRPVFVYVGINSFAPPMPGVVLPQRLRPSQMHLQLRDFDAGESIKIDRFQLIDFDFV